MQVTRPSVYTYPTREDNSAEGRAIECQEQCQERRNKVRITRRCGKEERHTSLGRGRKAGTDQQPPKRSGPAVITTIHHKPLGILDSIDAAAALPSQASPYADPNAAAVLLQLSSRLPRSSPIYAFRGRTGIVATASGGDHVRQHAARRRVCTRSWLHTLSLRVSLKSMEISTGHVRSGVIPHWVGLT